MLKVNISYSMIVKSILFNYVASSISLFLQRKKKRETNKKEFRLIRVDWFKVLFPIIRRQGKRKKKKTKKKNIKKENKSEVV